MDKSQEQARKCFCARCFLPIDTEDKVDIEGQNFHRHCSMCCICRTIPTSLKTFYGHVFCTECFKTHVMCRFRGDAPRMQGNSWWMQFANCPKNEDSKKDDDCKDCPKTEEPQKKCICARCLQVVCDKNKVDIGGQSFHTNCARCYCCHTVPKDSVKIYYGQVFCEECFHRHVINRDKDNSAEFFKNCFEQWQNSAQFAESMREFMAGNKDATPFVFMMNNGQQPFCRCGAEPQQEFSQSNEPRKSATPALSFGDNSLGACKAEDPTDVFETIDSHESATPAIEKSPEAAAAEKIEKLTKYLHERVNRLSEKEKKWKCYDPESLNGWVDLQNPNVSGDCPRCLWQCGTIYVNSDYLQKQVCSGDFL